MPKRAGSPRQTERNCQANPLHLALHTNPSSAKPTSVICTLLQNMPGLKDATRLTETARETGCDAPMRCQAAVSHWR